MAELPPEIREADFGDGDRSFIVELTTSPFGAALFAAPDTSERSRELLHGLAGKWDLLWPGILERMQQGIEDYCADQNPAVDDFTGWISLLDKHAYMGDRSDVHLRIEFAEPPLWDYFLRGTEIVHWQAVF